MIRRQYWDWIVESSLIWKQFLKAAFNTAMLSYWTRAWSSAYTNKNFSGRNQWEPRFWSLWMEALSSSLMRKSWGICLFNVILPVSKRPIDRWVDIDSSLLLQLWFDCQVPEEHKIIELVTSQCQFFSKQESMMTSLNGLFLDNYSTNSLVQIFTPTLAHVPQLLAPGILPKAHHSSYEGSSSSSNPSNENTPVESLGTRDARGFIRQQSFSSSSHKENNLKISSRSREGESGSKNLLAERRRRNKIKERLFALRAIVPKISKVCWSLS